AETAAGGSGIGERPPPPGRGGRSSASASSGAAAGAMTTNLRVSLLRDLRAAGILLVDAGQVAEILRAPPPLTPPTVAPCATAGSGVSTVRKGDGEGVSRYWSPARNGGGFVLVDCGLPSEGVTALAREGATGAHVIWRRIDPAKSSGRETAAVAEVLRELGPGAGAVGEACDGRKDDGDDEEVSDNTAVTAPYGGGDGETAVNGLVQANGGDGHADNGGGGGGGAPSPAGSGSGTSESNAPVDALTHVCFIGGGLGSNGGSSGSGGGGRGGGGRLGNDHGSSSASTVAAAAAARAAAPECRLARAASRSCLTAHVCVLEGGFTALEEALSRMGGSGSGRGGSSGLGVGGGLEQQNSGVVAGRPCGGGGGGPKSTAPLEGEELSAVVAAAGTTSSGSAEQQQQQQRQSAATSGGGVLPLTSAGSAPGKSSSTAGKGSPPTTTSPGG
ncbi:unnamed protein product, partial [Pylaiella littoralis]